MFKSNVQIGTSVNIIYGFKPLWKFYDEDGSPFFSLPCKPIRTSLPQPILEPQTFFSYPLITLHDEVKSLLSSLFEYRVLPFKGKEKVFNIPTGPLILDHPDNSEVLGKLGSYMGLDLTQDCSYMLVKLRRFSGEASHEVLRETGAVTFDKQLHLTKEGRVAMSRLRPGIKLCEGLKHDAIVTERQAEGYLDFFQNYGTHFVSKLYFGDYIFQVFAYSKENFTVLKEAFKNDSVRRELTGYSALSWNYYTNRSLVGQYGRIISHSGDKRLSQTIEQKKWHDEKYAKCDSIFTAFIKYPYAQTSFLGQFDKIVPIGFELTPINRFIEIFRSFSWQRILKGALIHQYGYDINLSVSRLRGYNWEDLLKYKKGEYPPIISQSEDIEICQPIVDLGKLELENHAKIKSLSVTADVMNASKKAVINIPGRSITFICPWLEAAEESPESTTLMVSEEAFSDLKLYIGIMWGVMRVVSEAGSRHYTLLDGFCFTEGLYDELSKRRKIELKNIRNRLSPQLLLKHSENLKILMAQLLLCCSRRHGSVFPVHLAHFYLKWMNELSFSSDELKAHIKGIENIAAALTKVHCSMQSAEEDTSTKDYISCAGCLNLHREWKVKYNEAARDIYVQKKNILRETTVTGNKMLNRSSLQQLIDCFFIIYRLRSELKEKADVNSAYPPGKNGWELIESVNRLHLKQVQAMIDMEESMREVSKAVDAMNLCMNIDFQQKQLDYMLTWFK
ncbi:MAG TPA: MAC/perforin domain-containing protein [Pseudobacteroides sp.]|uniref:MAC/perforin domain-containing protein n=1 Tax=Pseudobacteroides sp. TaxID=1968840 RepID=UPI002F95F54E